MTFKKAIGMALKEAISKPKVPKKKTPLQKRLIRIKKRGRKVAIGLKKGREAAIKQATKRQRTPSLNKIVGRLPQ